MAQPRVGVVIINDARDTLTLHATLLNDLTGTQFMF